MPATHHTIFATRCHASVVYSSFVASAHLGICRKVKCLFANCFIVRNSPLRCSGMARVNKGSHSFTCHQHVYPQMEWTIPAQPQSVCHCTLAGTHFSVPLRVEGWAVSDLMAGCNCENWNNLYWRCAAICYISEFDECRLSAGWLPTLRPSQLTWAVGPLVGC